MPPNIVFFICDSMDGRVMRCMEHPAAHTPNMDRMAAGGTLFRNAYCNSPQCAPSRASMWSGQYVHRVEAWNNPLGIAPDHPTFATHLQRHGYDFEVFGKTDYLVGGHSLKAHVTSWMRAAGIATPHNAPPVAQLVDDTPGVHEGDWAQIDACVAFVRDRAGPPQRPFCLYPSTSVPHPPFRTSQTYLDRIDPTAVTLPAYEPALHPVMEYMSVTKNTHGQFDDSEILAIRRHYFAMVAEVDAMLGAVLDGLEASGHADDTYVIFASDHGEMNMEHRQTLKNAMYEASARVPLIVAGPGLRRGQVVDDLVSLVDLFPTLLEMGDVDLPPDVDGTSLLPFCRGEPNAHPSWVLSEYHSNFTQTGIAMLREGDWKYVAYAGFAPQLFNLRDDPDELNDLADVRPKDVERLDEQLAQIMDFADADRRAKASDRAAFLDWRDSLTADAYREAMTKMHRGAWGADEDAQIEAWLAIG